MTIAIVGCMDRRLNGFFENIRNDILKDLPDEKVYIIRDAGGGVSAVEKTLYDLNITDIHDYTHTNCGAMKVAMAACEKVDSGTTLDDVESSPDVFDTNIKPFLGGKYESALAIEQKNTEIQTDTLNHLKMTHPDLQFSCNLIDLAKLDIPKVEGEHTLVIGMAYEGRYSDIANKYNLDLAHIYFVQANYLEEIRPAVKLAVEKLNIHKVMFVSNQQSEDDTIEKWSNDMLFRNMFDKYLIKIPATLHKPR